MNGVILNLRGEAYRVGDAPQQLVLGARLVSPADHINRQAVLVRGTPGCRAWHAGVLTAHLFLMCRCPIPTGDSAGDFVVTLCDIDEVNRPRLEIRRQPLE